MKTVTRTWSGQVLSFSPFSFFFLVVESKEIEKREKEMEKRMKEREWRELRPEDVEKRGEKWEKLI